jgi:hypothetical protein
VSSVHLRLLLLGFARSQRFLCGDENRKIGLCLPRQLIRILVSVVASSAIRFHPGVTCNPFRFLRQ